LGQNQPSGALSLRRLVMFWSGVDNLGKEESRPSANFQSIKLDLSLKQMNKIEIGMI
jgi:hypothetical protein